MSAVQLRQTFGTNGTQQDFNSITRKDWIQSIHLLPTSGTSRFVNKLKLTANSEDIRDLLIVVLISSPAQRQEQAGAQQSSLVQFSLCQQANPALA